MAQYKWLEIPDNDPTKGTKDNPYTRDEWSAVPDAVKQSGQPFWVENMFNVEDPNNPYGDEVKQYVGKGDNVPVKWNPNFKNFEYAAEAVTPAPVQGASPALASPPVSGATAAPVVSPAGPAAAPAVAGGPPVAPPAQAINMEDGSAIYAEQLKNFKPEEARKFADILTQYKDQIGNPITAAIKAAKPEFDQQQADRFKKVAAISSVGDAMKTIFSGVLSRKGGPVFDTSSPTTFDALKKYDEMVKQDETYSYQNKLAQAQQLASTLGMASQVYESEKARVSQQNMAMFEMQHKMAQEALDMQFKTKIYNASTQLDRDKLAQEWATKNKELALTVAEDTRKFQNEKDVANIHGKWQLEAYKAAYQNKTSDNSKLFDKVTAVPVDFGTGTPAVIPGQHVNQAIAYLVNRMQKTVGNKYDENNPGLLPLPEGAYKNWAENKPQTVADVAAIVAGYPEMFEPDPSSGFWRLKKEYWGGATSTASPTKANNPILK